MKKEKEEPDDEPPSHAACSKSELALRYMPNVQAASARRTLRAWIEKNPAFKEELHRAGYTDSCVLLTPRQVRIHYKYLGEP